MIRTGDQGFTAVGNVSRETMLCLQIYEDLLHRWQGVKNLVATSTLNDLRHRHFSDSAQLYHLAPNARTWIDLGSGAGFPGLVIAILKKEQKNTIVHLIESNQRKCAFLRNVVRETGCAAEVHCGRIEAILPMLTTPDIISARALAPLDALLQWSAPAIENGALGLFPKGQDVAAELTAIAKYSSFSYQLVPSQTDTRAAIVVVSATKSKSSSATGK